MQKTEFIRQLNELVPRPDPVTTEALYRFDRECAETEYIDMLTALRVVARNFSEETLQSAYEVIQHQNAALPSELFAAAVYFQAGRTPAEVSGLAKEGRLMGFFGPERPEEPSRIATCTIVESGQEQRFYTMDFGRFNPQHALKRAITYGRETGISATQAMARLTMDQPEFAEIRISYLPDVKMVESKSLKLYLFSFRNHGAFHEDCVNIIMKDLIRLMDPKYIEVTGIFTPRGGISIYPYANYGRPGTKYEEMAARRLMNHE